ncbi:MAG: porin, partial [Isosphaeraceae bacterium]|nr:porin [Isosphaeraceae bacterium]
PRFDMPAPVPYLPLRAHFGPGFALETDDAEFLFEFHDLTQLDGRFYQQGGQQPVADTFTVPRQWYIFSGRLTKPYEYYASLAQAFDGLSILDVYLNVNYDRRLQYRVGRFKTPFTYEFYAEPTPALANGEWSLFFNNFGINRDLGMMAWGELFQYRLDYAVGLFNSTRNGLLDLSDPKDAIAFLNLAPFETRTGSPLQNFNIGASADYGIPHHVPIPQVLRTIVPTAGNTAIGIPFLAFADNVLASGPRALWSLHGAWYYKHLSLIGEWQSGFQDYVRVGSPTRTHLPIESFYIQAAYLLTGETVASRGLVRPRRPFDLRRGKVGPGAWELAGRYSLLELGPQVFTDGLADPNLWSNRVYAIDLGVNWYWNQYIRVLFDWQHAEFGDPVLYRPGGLQKTSDLFLIRFQVWF